MSDQSGANVSSDAPHSYVWYIFVATLYWLLTFILIVFADYVPPVSWVAILTAVPPFFIAVTSLRAGRSRPLCASVVTAAVCVAMVISKGFLMQLFVLLLLLVLGGGLPSG